MANIAALVGTKRLMQNGTIIFESRLSAYEGVLEEDFKTPGYFTDAEVLSLAFRLADAKSIPEDAVIASFLLYLIMNQ